MVEKIHKHLIKLFRNFSDLQNSPTFNDLSSGRLEQKYVSGQSVIEPQVK